MVMGQVTNLAKVGVVGSNPIARSNKNQGFPWVSDSFVANTTRLLLTFNAEHSMNTTLNVGNGRACVLFLFLRRIAAWVTNRAWSDGSRWHQPRKWELQRQVLPMRLRYKDRGDFSGWKEPGINSHPERVAALKVDSTEDERASRGYTGANIRPC